MLTEIIDAKVKFIEQPFLTPLIISSGAITEITEARVEMTVRANDKEATGRGNMYLSYLWTWPGQSLTHKQRDGIHRMPTRTPVGLGSIL